MPFCCLDNRWEFLLHQYWSIESIQGYLHNLFIKWWGVSLMGRKVRWARSQPTHLVLILLICLMNSWGMSSRCLVQMVNHTVHGLCMYSQIFIYFLKELHQPTLLDLCSLFLFDFVEGCLPLSLSVQSICLVLWYIYLMQQQICQTIGKDLSLYFAGESFIYVSNFLYS